MKIGDPSLSINNTPRVSGNKVPEDPKELMEVCREFEAVFLNMMLQEMRKTVPESNLTEKSYARQLYESMQDEEIAKEMAKGQGIGLAQQIYRQLSRK